MFTRLVCYFCYFFFLDTLNYVLSINETSKFFFYTSAIIVNMNYFKVKKQIL